METGVVKWFNEAEGFGFISPDNGGKDVLVNFSAIVTKGSKTLTAAQRVEFSTEDDPKGPSAANVTPSSA